MYTGYFGFRVAPFSVTPDPRFFYTNPIYQEAMAALRYGIEAKKGFIVITGEAGTGKTTLLRRLMHNLEATIHPVFIFDSDVRFTALLRIILRDLGLGKEKRDKSVMIEQLNEYLIEQAKKKHIVAVLIDEAQNLSDQTLEGLRLLSNLETDTEKLIQIVLTGQPELERKLDRPGLCQLKQRVAFQCQLVPLNGREVSPYVDHRLQAAGYEGAGLFDPDAIEQIALYSRGIPRLINTICDNALLIAYATSQERVSREIVTEVARDMRLGLQIEAVDTKVPTVKATSRESEHQTVSTSATRRLPYEPRHRVRLGVWIPLLLFFLGSATALTYTLHAKNRLLSLSVKVEEELGQFVEEDSYKGLAGPIARASETEKAPMPPKSMPAQEASKMKRYRVKEGDYLYSILRKQFGIESNEQMQDALNRVKELNPQKNNWDILFVGEVLVFPRQLASFLG